MWRFVWGWWRIGSYASLEKIDKFINAPNNCDVSLCSLCLYVSCCFDIYFPGIISPKVKMVLLNTVSEP